METRVEISASILLSWLEGKVRGTVGVVVNCESVSAWGIRGMGVISPLHTVDFWHCFSYRKYAILNCLVSRSFSYQSLSGWPVIATPCLGNLSSRLGSIGVSEVD